MLFKKYNEHIEQTEPLSRELIILDFGKSKQLNIGKFMWQTKNNIIPETISELLKKNIEPIGKVITGNSLFRM